MRLKYFLLLIFLLFIPIVKAENILITVNVVPAPPIPPIGYVIFGALFPILIGVGGIILFLETWLVDTIPEEKIRLFIAGVIILFTTIVGIGLIT